MRVIRDRYSHPNAIAPIRAAWRSTAIVVTVGAALSACSEGEANEAVSELQTEVLSRRTIVSSVEATGTIEPIRIIEVKSQAGGEILELPVELGDYVEQGTLLVRIDPRDVRNAFEQAQADLDVAEARIDVAERQLKRIQSLRDSDIVTEEELEAAILEHATARAGIVRARTNLELAEDRVNDVTLRAPISGTIVERTIEEGQVITGTRDLTGGTALMRMADLKEVQVRTLVDETDIGSLSSGLEAEITVEAYPDHSFRGAVLKIEPSAVVQQNVTMFAVLTRIVNEDDLLRPGMNADVQIVVGQEEDVLALPNMAVKTPDEARQLVNALGMDAAALSARAEPADEASRGPAAGQERGQETSDENVTADDAAAGEEEAVVGGRRMSEIQTMSQDERREWFMNLSAGDRQRMMQRFQQQREQQQQADRSNPSRPKPAFVFVYDEIGALQVKPVTIGLSNYEHTRILSGLEEGDAVVTIPLSLISQQEFMERIRSRSGVPGVSRGS